MATCESLATKSELAELSAKIDGLNAKIDGFLAQLNQKAEKQEVEAVKVELAKKADRSWVEQALDQLKEWAQNALDALKAATDAAISGVRNWAEAALDALRNLIESLFNRDDIERLWAALSGKVDKNQGIGINGSYENGGINLTVTANQIGSDTSYVNLFIPDMGDYVTKPEFETHKNLPIPDAHDYDNNIDLSQYVKKGSGMGIGGSYVDGGINLTITSELGTDNETINLFLGNYVEKPEFDQLANNFNRHINATLNEGVHGGYVGEVGIGGSYVDGGINLTISTPFGSDNTTIDLFLDSYASKSDLDKKVDKNQGIGIGGSYENGGIRLTVFADQIGNDSEFVPLFIGGGGGGGVPWSDFMAHLNDPTAHNLGQSGFEAFWDGAGIGFVLTIAGQSFSDDVRIYPEVDLELIERELGDELKVKVSIGSESSTESVFFMSNAKINKIYQILGGDRWFPQSGQSPRFKPDEEIRAKCSGHYDGDSNMQATGLPTADLIELIWASQAPNYQKLGLKDYPANVPSTLLKHLREPRKISSLAEWLGWFIKSFDGLIGEFPVDIKITDADLLQEGEQELNIRIHNIAEALKELWGIGLNSRMVEDAILETTMRDLMETGASRKMGIVNHYAIKSIQEYLGFKIKEKELDVNFSFDPGVAAKNDSSNLWEFLQKSNQKIKIDDCDEDKSFERDLMVLLEAARIIKGSMFHTWRGVEAEKQRIKDALDEFDKNSDDFDIWLEKVETGFINDAALDDTANPYGRAFSQRPRVKDVGLDQLDPQQ